jgi:hypothetical protein
MTVKCGNVACTHNKDGYCKETEIELKHGYADIPKGEEHNVDDESDIDKDNVLEYLICKNFKW